MDILISNGIMSIEKDITSKTRRVFLTATLNASERLYWLDAEIMQSKQTSSSNIMAISTGDSYDLWHNRFGHPGKQAVVNLPKNVKGTPQSIKVPSTLAPCHGCELGKSHRLPFPPSESRALAPLDLIHMDLVEKPSLSIDKFKYEYTFYDDYSSFGLMYYMKRKSDSFVCFQSYKAWAEKQLNRQIKCVRSDRGGEFMSNEFIEYLNEQGIEQQLSVARSPQQNGRAERFQQTIANKAEAMRHFAGLSSGFWKLASETAVHIYNRQPLRRLGWKPPITAWNESVPDVSYFRVFGCKAFVHI